MEFAGLRERITASACIDHEQRFVRRGRIKFGERPFHFLELRHEIRFSVLAARRIAKQKVDLALRRRLVRFIAKRGRISTVLAANHFNAESFSPNSKLLDRRGTKRVGCRQHHLRRAIEVDCPYLQMMREFCCRCCFAGSVHADNQNQCRFAIRATDRRRISRQNPCDLFAHGLDHIANSKHRPGLTFLKCLDDSRCHRHTEIRADERLFKLLPVDWLGGKLLNERLEKFHMKFLQSLVQQFASKPIDWEELEESLIRADLGVPMATRIIKTLQEREAWSVLGIGDVIKAVREEIARILAAQPKPIRRVNDKPTVILIVGVNGTGKTTSTAKLAHYLQAAAIDHNRPAEVMLAAADTFRAAAIEQLGVWAERLGVEIIRGQYGG